MPLVGDDAITQRCWAYLKTIGPSQQGERDTKLFQAAKIIFWDFGLDEAAGLQLLRAYNDQSVPHGLGDNRVLYKMVQALGGENCDKPRRRQAPHAGGQYFGDSVASRNADGLLATRRRGRQRY